MNKIYIYNKKTRTLHIKGYCCYAISSANDPSYKEFETEDDVKNFTNGDYRMCRSCLKKRDKILSQSKKAL